MRPSYPSLCSISIFFRKRDKLSRSASAIINLSMVSIVDSLLSMLHASANRILHCEANTQFIGSGYASSLSFFFLGCRPDFSATQHSHRRALPLLNLKKKRDYSQSTTYNNKSTGCFEKICDRSVETIGMWPILLLGYQGGAEINKGGTLKAMSMTAILRLITQRLSSSLKPHSFPLSDQSEFGCHFLKLFTLLENSLSQHVLYNTIKMASLRVEQTQLFPCRFYKV